jgi:hypothetical protein
MIVPPVPSILLVMVYSLSSGRNFYAFALLFPPELVVALLLFFECRGCSVDYSTTDPGDFKLTYLSENVLCAPSGIVDSRMNWPVVPEPREFCHDRSG